MSTFSANSRVLAHAKSCCRRGARESASAAAAGRKQRGAQLRVALVGLLIRRTRLGARLDDLQGGAEGCGRGWVRRRTSNQLGRAPASAPHQASPSTASWGAHMLRGAIKSIAVQAVCAAAAPWRTLAARAARQRRRRARRCGPRPPAARRRAQPTLAPRAACVCCAFCVSSCVCVFVYVCCVLRLQCNAPD